jgi:transposase
MVKISPPNLVKISLTLLSRHSDSKYACLLVNFKNGLILDVLESRKKSSLREYFRSIPLEEREKVIYVSMDMYENYKNIAEKYLPNATICIDSCHVIKTINDALDKVRIKVMNRYRTYNQSDEYYLLKHKKALLFIDSNKVNDQSFKYNHHFKRKLSDEQLLNMILEIDKELKEAYEMKEYYAIFNVMKKERNEVEDYLEGIINEYALSSITSFNQISLTLKNWKKEIINSFEEYEGRRINNGPIEGRNKYIKILLNLANGYRNFKRFRNRVLYVFNKYDLPSENPKETKSVKLPGIIRGKYNKKDSEK